MLLMIIAAEWLLSPGHHPFLDLGVDPLLRYRVMSDSAGMSSPLIPGESERSDTVRNARCGASSSEQCRTDIHCVFVPQGSCYSGNWKPGTRRQRGTPTPSYVDKPVCFLGEGQPCIFQCKRRRAVGEHELGRAVFLHTFTRGQGNGREAHDAFGMASSIANRAHTLTPFSSSHTT